MEKEFVPYELALRMKQLGFDEPCFSFYAGGFNELWTIKLVNPNKVHQSNVLAPLYQQAFRWFRENHGLDHEIPYAGRKGEYHAFVQSYIYGNNRNDPSMFTYEDAQKECLTKLLEIAEQK
jgi:hypothetical protein